MKILITGATGMVGRNLRADPRAGDHQLLCPGRAELDLRDPAACQAFLAAHRPEAVIHAASVVGGIQANIDSPIRFLADNVLIGVNIIQASLDNEVSVVLNIASSCMYPRGCEGVLSPDLLLKGELEPTNEGYALAKLVTARLTQFVRREQPHLTYKTLIPCNLYGEFDHFDPIQSHLVPAAIRKVLEAKDMGFSDVEIWGDGTARREFMFAADLADFVWTQLPQAGSLPDLMNVGVGHDYTVREYYEMVAKVCGYSGGFSYDLTKPAGMRRKLLDISQQGALGWFPRTDLCTGVSRAIDFYRALSSR